MARWFLAVFAAVAVSTSGCQLGRVSLAMNKDSAVPYPTLDVLPNQWEPEITDEVMTDRVTEDEE